MLTSKFIVSSSENMLNLSMTTAIEFRFPAIPSSSPMPTPAPMDIPPPPIIPPILMPPPPYIPIDIPPPAMPMLMPLIPIDIPPPPMRMPPILQKKKGNTTQEVWEMKAEWKAAERKQERGEDCFFSDSAGGRGGHLPHAPTHSPHSHAHAHAATHPHAARNADRRESVRSTSRGACLCDGRAVSPDSPHATTATVHTATPVHTHSTHAHGHASSHAVLQGANRVSARRGGQAAVSFFTMADS